MAYNLGAALDSERRIKLIALDLDGTLTNSKKEVSVKNREAIRRAQSAGIKIAIASGRPVVGTRSAAKALGLDEIGGYIIAGNGGEIVDCGAGKSIAKRTVPIEYTSAICKAGSLFEVSVLTYINDDLVCESDTDPYVQKEAYNNGIKIHKVQSVAATIKESVIKFMIVGAPPTLKKVQSHLIEHIGDGVNVFFSEPYFLEITPLGIEKSTSLSYLCGILGIDASEVMAMGDGLNDVPMLKWAGVSVVMANGCNEAKECADFVSASNDDDGVAVAVDHFLRLCQ